MAARDFKGALEAFEKAVEINPRSALAHFELGLLYEQNENDYAAAIYHYNQVVKLRPNKDYPAENALARIPGCRQELIKADAAATINPAMLRETERLRDENGQLKKLVDSLRGQLANRPAVVTNYVTNVISPLVPAVRSDLRKNPALLGDAARSSPGSRPAAKELPESSRGARTHVVKAGETLVAIARQHGMRLDALLAANPNVDPKRLRVGQALVIPTP